MSLSLKLEQVKTIAVIGAGVMGHAIAELAALAGYGVRLYDIQEEIVRKGFEQIRWSLDKLAAKGVIPSEAAAKALPLIQTTTDLEEAACGADFVIEAAPEDLALKRDLFATLDRLTPEHAVLATNTSSLPITQVAEATARPERVVGMHFFNPAVLMPLVEVIKGRKTSEEAVELTVALAKALKKTPVVCRKDVRGFITSRTFEGFMGEAMWLVSRGESRIRAVDARMKLHEGFPMGPFELADLTGLDIGYNVRREAGQPNPPILEERVRAGHLGRKTGRGFYDYDYGGGKGPDYTAEDGEEFDPLPIYAVMANIAAGLVGDEVATPQEVDLAMRLGGGFPQGPLAKADEIGLDVILDFLKEAHRKYGDERYKPAPLLVQKVQQGQTGKQAGRGFYAY